MTKREQVLNELLVLRCKEGDASAFEELVERWQERLWRHAWRLTGNENAAWDVLQETWIGIVRGLSRLEHEAAFPTWAYRMISNKCRDWIRRETRHRKANKTYAETIGREEGKTASTHERHASLKEALGNLPGRDRAILSLHYEDGFDVGEIAEILQIPEGTVKSRLHYARQRLRAKMEGTEDE